MPKNIYEVQNKKIGHGRKSRENKESRMNNWNPDIVENEPMAPFFVNTSILDP